jgi:hypothetical protein
MFATGAIAMEMDRFDRLARTLATVGTRRALVQVLPLIGGLGALSCTTATAKKRKSKKKCKKPCGSCATCKKGKCKPKADGTVCGPDQVCSTGECIVPACGAGGPCRVFLSSTLYDGNLGGLVGADAKCQGLAAAAGLPGTYKVWLSDSTSAPISRFVPSSGPYRLVNGTTVATSFADLTDGMLLAPINVTETGGSIGAANLVWAHTRSDGSPGGVKNQHCVNWSSNASGSTGDSGYALATGPQWTTFFFNTCDLQLHLYCFQQR